MTGTVITNFCERISLFCINHDEPMPMQVISNTELIKTPFYACENYHPKDKGIRPCPNRLNMDDYLGIVEKFMDTIINGDFMADYTNFEFSYKGTRQKILVRCLKYTDKEIHLGIRNQTVLGK